MLENAYYSVISPEGCATILFKDAAAGAARGRGAALTAPDLLRLGIVDGVVPEPDGGAHTDQLDGRREPEDGDRRAACASCSALPPRSSLERRYERFRAVRRARARQPVLPADRREPMTEPTSRGRTRS